MPWILALHVFGVIFWMGSLLVILSLLGLVPDEVGVVKERFIAAARRLFDVGANLGAVVAIAFGIWLVLIEPVVLRQGWFHLKLLLVVGLIVVHARLHLRLGALEKAPAKAARGEFKMLHGVVSLLLILILLLVFRRPF